MAALTSTITPHIYNHPTPHVVSRKSDISPVQRAATYHVKSKMAISTADMWRSSPALSGNNKDIYGASAAPVSASSPRAGGLRKTLRNVDYDHASFVPNNTSLSSTHASRANHPRLQKRSKSGSVSSMSTSAQIPTPRSTDPYLPYSPPVAEPFPEITTPSTIKEYTTPKIKPYLRKMSGATAKDDSEQGRLDLSKSTSENEALNGLGIQDFGACSVSDVAFSQVPRNAHSRTISGGSQVSVGSASGSIRPNQPFVHPMRQTPRPYTPPTVPSSYPSSMQGDDADAQESDDLVTEDDVHFAPGFRSARSTSVSSFSTAAPPQIQPHVLAQSLLHRANSSQTNLSQRSGRSSHSKLTGRRRRDTDPSANIAPSSRTSLDKAFSFVSASRRSETPASIDPTTQHARISAARAAFAEKEALKDRKLARAELKRRETEARKTEQRRRRSEVTTPTIGAGRRTSEDESRPASSSARRRSSTTNAKQKSRSKPPTDMLRSHSYDDAHPAPLPRLAGSGFSSSKLAEPLSALPSPGPATATASSSPQTGWVRFSAWLQTRLLNCGGDGGDTSPRL